MSRMKGTLSRAFLAFVFLTLSSCGFQDLTLMGSIVLPWSVKYFGAGTGSVSWPQDAALDIHRNVYYVSYTDGLFSGTQIGTHGTTDGYIVKLNRSGRVVWSVQIGSGAGTQFIPMGVAPTSSGPIVYGYTSGTIGDQLGVQGAGNSVVLKLDPDTGAILWAKQMAAGGATNTFAYVGPSLVDEATGTI